MQRHTNTVRHLLRNICEINLALNYGTACDTAVADSRLDGPWRRLSKTAAVVTGHRDGRSRQLVRTGLNSLPTYYFFFVIFPFVLLLPPAQPRLLPLLVQPQPCPVPL